MPTPEATLVLAELSAGDRSAADRLWPLIEHELRALALHHFNGERAGSTLQLTALVDDAYMRLIDQSRVQWQNRAHFFGVAATIIRRLLVDHARERAALKRGGGGRAMALDEDASICENKGVAAAQLLSPAEGASRRAFTGANARRLASFLTNLGIARAGLGEFTAAEADLLEARPIFVANRGEAHKDTRDCTQALVDLYTAWHAAEPGTGHDAIAAEWKKKLEASELQAPESRPDEKK